MQAPEVAYSCIHSSVTETLCQDGFYTMPNDQVTALLTEATYDSLLEWNTQVYDRTYKEPEKKKPTDIAYAIHGTRLG